MAARQRQLTRRTDMDLEDAVQAHSAWKIQLRTAIAKKETLDAEVIGADDQCQLGKWLRSAAKLKYGSLRSYAECVACHAAFHTAAGNVAAMINAKKFEDAAAMLNAGTPFAKASLDVGIALGALKREAKL